MYNQFVKNLNHYLALNASDDKVPNRRYQIGKSLKPLADIDRFKRLKDDNPQQYHQLCALIWALDSNERFATIAWDLWGRGFDKADCAVDGELLADQLKLVDLLLGTQYWA